MFKGGAVLPGFMLSNGTKISVSGWTSTAFGDFLGDAATALSTLCPIAPAPAATKGCFGIWFMGTFVGGTGCTGKLSTEKGKPFLKRLTRN